MASFHPPALVSKTLIALTLATEPSCTDTKSCSAEAAGKVPTRRSVIG